MFTLARETNWSEEYILWELPFVRALQYRHCVLRSNDVWTVPASGNIQSDIVDEVKRITDLVAEDDLDDWG